MAGKDGGTLVLVDNYDSFTHNIYQYLQEIGAKTVVIKNDELPLNHERFLSATAIVLSPGPGRPEESGVSLQLLEQYYREIPFLGICLGHQMIAHFFGGAVRQADNIMHGKTSKLFHNETGVFVHLDQDFVVARYHSLVVDTNTVPDCLEVNAWTNEENDELVIMGLRHREFHIQGVQFHPEAIQSQHGHQVFRNFLCQIDGFR